MHEDHYSLSGGMVSNPALLRARDYDFEQQWKCFTLAKRTRTRSVPPFEPSCAGLHPYLVSCTQMTVDGRHQKLPVKRLGNVIVTAAVDDRIAIVDDGIGGNGDDGDIHGGDRGA